MKKLFLLIAMAIFILSSCENYSNGDRVGMLTKFSKSGNVWKSYEGQLNMTQTGMNTSGEAFAFSIDNDNEPQGLVATLDSANRFGWKIKLTYHEVNFKNWFFNRGDTSYFITKCEVLDKDPIGNSFNPNDNKNAVTSTQSNKQADTVYVVIVDKSRLKD